jgi:hypothetical protein
VAIFSQSCRAPTEPLQLASLQDEPPSPPLLFLADGQLDTLRHRRPSRHDMCFGCPAFMSSLLQFLPPSTSHTGASRETDMAVSRPWRRTPAGADQRRRCNQP